MVPEGWKVFTIGEIAKIQVGRDIQELNFSENMTAHHIHPVYSNTVDQQGLYGYYDFEEYGGDAVTIVGRGAGLGTAFYKSKPFGAIGRLLVLHPREESFSPQFLTNYINSQLRIFNESGGIPQLPGSSLAKYEILLPPLLEQKKIADILSAWDRAIEATEKLLVNAERQKRGLMQQLLTGKRRLPGFSGSWMHSALAEISTRVQRKTDGGEHPILTISSASGFVRQDEKYRRYMAGKSVENYVLLRKGEFAYNKGNSKAFEFGCVFDLNEFQTGLVPHVYVCFRLKGGLNQRFFRALFAADYLRPQLSRLVNTGVRNNGLLNISPSEFLSIQVPVPSYAEQEALGTILEKATALEVKLRTDLELLRLEKSALMQQLLTGKRRVTV